MYGVDAMGETAETCSPRKYKINRADQDKFALWSQQRRRAPSAKRFEKLPFSIPLSAKAMRWFYRDEFANQAQQ